MIDPRDLFADSYHDARARFARALDAFEQQSGRGFARQRHVIDAALDLTIDTAELQAQTPERLFVAVSGIHGVEGYAGSAIQQALLARTLSRFDLDRTGVLFVHALNPHGMQHFQRVNAANVDLNRNFGDEDGALYRSDAGDYRLLSRTFEPQRPYGARLSTHARFFAEIAAATARHGIGPLRQATLAGQYVAPGGIFYGGASPQPETLFFQRVFSALCTRYAEIMLTDLHTGYGERGRAYPLFGRADSAEFAAFSGQGVRDAGGRDRTYTAHGDLVGFCHDAAKRARPDGVFNGVVVELGTHGLGMLSQLGDLHAVVRENQVRRHGARTPAIAAAVQRAFRELFYPGDSAWRAQALEEACSRIESLLASRGFLPAAAQGPNSSVLVQK